MPGTPQCTRACPPGSSSRRGSCHPVTHHPLGHVQRVVAMLNLSSVFFFCTPLCLAPRHQPILFNYTLNFRSTDHYYACRIYFKIFHFYLILHVAFLKFPFPGWTSVGVLDLTKAFEILANIYFVGHGEWRGWEISRIAFY